MILTLIFVLIPASLRAATPLTLTDTHSHPLTVPAKTPTLLLFLRADQPQSLDELSQLPPLLKDRNLQVIAILSGDDADTNAPRLAPKCPWPIVADTPYALSGKFEVHVWPTTVLLAAGTNSDDPKILAHIPGLPLSFPADLPAYLDFAAGRIDKATLDKRLADRDLVVDTSNQKAARHVEVAQRLAAQGMKQEARAELAKALALHPSDGQLLLTIARASLATGDLATADPLLASAKNVPPGQLATLKAWSAIQHNDFPTARQLLEQSLPLNPDPAEADYLYGLVLQHDNDSPKAATYFRQAFENTPTGRQLGLSQ